MGQNLLRSDAHKGEKTRGHSPRAGFQMDPRLVEMLAGSNPLQRSALSQAIAPSQKPLRSRPKKIMRLDLEFLLRGIAQVLRYVTGGCAR